MESKGFTVAVFNRTVEKVDHFIGRRCGKNFIGAHSIEELCIRTRTSAKVMMLVKAGKWLDDFIDLLIPHLEEGDYYWRWKFTFPDTVVRSMLKSKGLLYIGTGVRAVKKGLARSFDDARRIWLHGLLWRIFSRQKVEGDVPCCDW